MTIIVTFKDILQNLFYEQLIYRLNYFTFKVIPCVKKTIFSREYYLKRVGTSNFFF